MSTKLHKMVNLSWWALVDKLTWPYDIARSRDALKPQYLHYQSVYEYQTWQDGNLPW